eukprot:15478015-Alexandrium_andersonii.AAC.1
MDHVNEPMLSIEQLVIGASGGCGILKCSRWPPPTPPPARCSPRAEPQNMCPRTWPPALAGEQPARAITA